MNKIGVDLSNWNSISDIKKAKDKGLDFVILKAGSGVTPVDGKFNNIYEQCKRYSVPVGAYWYLYAKTTKGAIKEADMFLNAVKGKEFEYPLWLDFEDSSQNNIGKIQKTEIAISFMDRVEKQGYYIGMYTMGSWFNKEFDYNYKYKEKTLKEFDKWVAHWTYSPSKKSPYVDGGTGIWQYSNRGEFSGIGKAGTGLDMNIAYRDYPKIIKKRKLNGFKNSNSSINREIIIVSKIENINMEESIKTLRNKLKEKYYVVETVSGNFDYSKIRESIIIGVGGSISNHSSYIKYFIGGNEKEAKNKINEIENCNIEKFAIKKER